MGKLNSTRWICQAGFIFDVDGERIVVDPYMSDSCAPRFPRMVKVPVPFERLKPDFVLFSHDHRDHFDPETVPTLYKLYKDCRFAGPLSTYEHFRAMGFDTLRFQTLSKGNAFDFGAFKVRPTTAYHSDPLAIGMLFDFDGKLVYFSGDTEFRDSLADDIISTAAGAPIDAVIICINGKLGNMNWRDAVKVVSKIKPKIAVPMHYGLFAGNTEDPKPFAAEVEKAGVKCVIASTSEPIAL